VLCNVVLSYEVCKVYHQEFSFDKCYDEVMVNMQATLQLVCVSDAFF
jgi:hypothetical protein